MGVLSNLWKDLLTYATQEKITMNILLFKVQTRLSIHVYPRKENECFSFNISINTKHFKVLCYTYLLNSPKICYNSAITLNSRMF